MGSGLSLSNVQQTGDVVVRREISKPSIKHELAIAFTHTSVLTSILLTAGQQETATAALLTYPLHGISLWMYRRKHKPKGLKEEIVYCLQQLESLTGTMAPKTAGQELALMRKALQKGESVDFDPYEFMMVPRPEGRTTWAKLHKKGILSLYPNKSLDNNKMRDAWDSQFNA